VPRLERHLSSVPLCLFPYTRSDIFGPRNTCTFWCWTCSSHSFASPFEERSPPLAACSCRFALRRERSTGDGDSSNDGSRLLTTACFHSSFLQFSGCNQLHKNRQPFMLGRSLDSVVRILLLPSVRDRLSSSVLFYLPLHPARFPLNGYLELPSYELIRLVSSSSHSSFPTHCLHS
jgi:hypothetical protein